MTMSVNQALSESGLLDESGVAAFCRPGHFLYESGDHGDLWLALGLLYADPRRLQRAAVQLADKLRPYAPDIVCGPVVGGALLGQWVAHELGVTFVYAEQHPGDATAKVAYAVPPELRSALRGARTVIVDDVINAGSATFGGVRAVEAWGGMVVGVAGLMVRAPGVPEMCAGRGLQLEYLAGLQWNTWPAGGCPLCSVDVPLE
jgi:orotate phosphoribosyltransferase